MPRAISTDPTTPHLRRNQACHQCRKKKAKCDAKSPCSTCERAHAHMIRINPVLAPEEPECTYDNPEEIADGAKARMAKLEARIEELEEIIRKKDAELASCKCRPRTLSPSFASSPSLGVGTTSMRPSVSPMSSDTEAFDLSAQSLSQGVMDNVFPISMDADLYSNLCRTPEFSYAPNSPAAQLMTTDWPLNVPPRELLLHLVDTFFACAPMAPRLLHRSTFMTSLMAHPLSQDFPHVAVLHSICALASLYTPVVTDKPENPDLGLGETSFFHAEFQPRFVVREERLPYIPKTIEDVLAGMDDGFGPTQIRWAGATLRSAVTTGDRMLQLLQAAIIGTWYWYSVGRSVPTYGWIGHACRCLLPLGLTSTDGFEPLSRLPPTMLKVLLDTNTPTQAEMAINAFWMVYSLEKIYNMGTSWPLYLSDDDISQVMPCRYSEFIAEEPVPLWARQKLFTPRMLVTHPPQATDSFSLYIKSSILLGKVKTFNVRYRLRYSNGQENTSFGDEPTPDPRETAEFLMLDNLIKNFITSIPKDFRDPIRDDKVDSVLYTGLLLPHVSIILLHDPHADISSPNCLSAERLLAAARAILDLIYKISATTYDPILLDHACSFCWFVAGATLIRFLRTKMEAGDEMEVARINQELGAIRFMLSSLGKRTVIGLRQIKLLDDIYSLEIERVVKRQAAMTGNIVQLF